MPCYDHRGHEDTQRMYREAEENSVYIDQLTAMLCAMCREAPEAMDVETRLWFEEHARIDEERADDA